MPKYSKMECIWTWKSKGFSLIKQKCVFFPFSFHPQKGACANQNRKSRTGRGGKAHWKKCVCKVSGRQVGKRNPDADNGKQVVEKGKPGQSVSAEIAAEAKVYTCKHHIPYIAPHILASKQNYFGVVGKQPDKRLCVKLHKDAGGNSPYYCHYGSIAQGEACPVMLSGADILGAECGYCLEHGRWH